MVFPAYAGVSPNTLSPPGSRKGLPRLRGGEPASYEQPYCERRSSPPTRG